MEAEEQMAVARQQTWLERRREAMVKQHGVMTSRRAPRAPLRQRSAHATGRSDD